LGEQGNYVVYSNRVDHLPAELVHTQVFRACIEVIAG
jgi:hypothetical protein